MADTRYFKVEKDTSLPRAFRAVRDNAGVTFDYEVEGVSHDAGTVVPSDHIDPRVVERLDDGDEHLNKLLTEVDKAAFDESLKSGSPLRVPEHTVEAYVLAADPEQPYQLLGQDAAVELAGANVEAAAEHQKAVKEEVGDDLDHDADVRPAIDFAAAKGAADLENQGALTPLEFVKGEKDSDVEVPAPVENPVEEAQAGNVSPSSGSQTEATNNPLGVDVGEGSSAEAAPVVEEEKAARKKKS